MDLRDRRSIDSRQLWKSQEMCNVTFQQPSPTEDSGGRYLLGTHSVPLKHLCGLLLLFSGSFVDAIIKTCLAAGVTFIVIMMCVIADCTSKWRIRQRVRRAMAAREQGILKAVVVTGDAIQL